MRNFGLGNYASLFGMGGLGSTNSLYSQLSQYSSIKSGAYGKLTKAYYAKNSEHSKHSSGTSKKTDALNRFYESKTSDSIKALKSVETESNELVKAANKLTSSGKDGVFADEKGFNMDAAYDAVGKFVSEYNDTLKSLSGTGDASVRGSGNRMKQMTDIMKNSLSKVGISIGEDGWLSVSEENFKNADYRKLKSVFGGKNSYADIISGYASGIGSSARNAENRSAGGVYGSNGAYNSYYGGMYYNGYV